MEYACSAWIVPVARSVFVAEFAALAAWTVEGSARAVGLLEEHPVTKQAARIDSLNWQQELGKTPPPGFIFLVLDAE